MDFLAVCRQKNEWPPAIDDVHGTPQRDEFRTFDIHLDDVWRRRRSGRNERINIDHGDVDFAGGGKMARGVVAPTSNRDLPVRSPTAAGMMVTLESRLSSTCRVK